MTMKVGKAWRCSVCGYVHNGDEPPEECPVCGVSASEFEPVEVEASVASLEDQVTGRIVIAGAGIAGLSAAEAIREKAPEAEVVLLSTEAEPPYYRLNLTRFLAGEISERDLPIHPMEWYAEKRIKLRVETSMQDIDRSNQSIGLQDGSRMHYDKLVVTTGAYPFVPPIEGSEKSGIFTLRTADQAQEILAALELGTRVACIGGGILGLETAGALARRGAKVTVLEAFDHLMPRQLNATGGEVLLRHLGSLGIDVVTRAQAEAFEGEATIAGVRLKDGRTIPAEMAVITVGVRSNIWMLKEAGLLVKNGVLVDHFLRTSDPNIFAAGDVAEHDGVLYGSWAAAQYQGKIAGMNAAGMANEFGGIPRSHMLKVLGKDMVSIGRIHAEDGRDNVVDDLSAENYRMFLLHDGEIAGALLIGDTSLATAAREAVEAQKGATGQSAREIVENLL